MIHAKTLFEKLVSIKLLKKAWKELNKKRSNSRGLTGPTIKEFSEDLENNLRKIQSRLVEGKYEFSLLKYVAVPKKGKPSKKRPLQIAVISDRVVLKAIAILIEKGLKRKFRLNNIASYAYRSEFGPKRAWERIETIYKKHNPVALKGDIVNFFDEINKAYLLNELVFKNLPDPSLNVLIFKGLSQEIGNPEDIFDPTHKILLEKKEKGIPQGAALSPLFSNIYLSEFDRTMLKKGYHLIRYADDFVVMCKSEKQAKKAYDQSVEILSKLGLRLHPLRGLEGKTVIKRITQEPLEFLSVCYNGREKWPSKKKHQGLITSISEVTATNRHKNVVSLVERVNKTLVGWLAAFYYTDVDRYFKSIDETIDRRLFVGLKELGWNLRDVQKKSGVGLMLTEHQRVVSGVPYCKEIIENIRSGN